MQCVARFLILTSSWGSSQTTFPFLLRNGLHWMWDITNKKLKWLQGVSSEWVARFGSVYILSRRESCGYLDSTSREKFYTIFLQDYHINSKLVFKW